MGDAAALPAIARIVEESPSGMRTEVVAELPDGERPPGMPDGTRVRCVPVAPGTSSLGEIVTDVELPDGTGYVNVGGEAAATRAARKALRHVRRLPAERYGVLGYWRRDADRFRRSYEAAPERFARAWADAESHGGDDEGRVLELYEGYLTEAGLI